MTRVGVISDTHGLLRPEAVEALRGCELIVHAGDVGDADILQALGEIAPVHAVRGNVDRGPWAEALPYTAVVEVGETLLYVLHIREELDLDPPAAGLSAVIFGHTHRAEAETKDGVLYLNPGAAGRNYGREASLAILEVEGGRIEVTFVEL